MIKQNLLNYHLQYFTNNDLLEYYKLQHINPYGIFENLN